MRCSAMVVACLVSSVPAFADNANTLGTEPDPAPAAMPAPVAVVPAVAPAPARAASGFRNGFSLSAGQEFGTTNTNVDVSGQLYGLDWRIGARLAPQWSAYVQSHLSLGNANISNGQEGATGNLAVAVMGERDLPGRTFVAIGGGYGVLNNPSGPLFAMRAGWYPMQPRAEGVARHLNLALDARFYFVEQGGESLTMNHIAVSLGYDRF